ncbi:MAG: nucleotidyltransferase family protein [Caldilineales bacterium]
MTSHAHRISAIVPAAGLSSRMGGPLPKPLLPWGTATVIETVVNTLLAAAVDEIIIVTGHRGEEIEARLRGYAVRCVRNPHYHSGEMLSSIQTALAAADSQSAGALLALADQPQMEAAVARQVVEAFRVGDGGGLIVPSYAMRRGHPITLPRRLWPEILALSWDNTLRSVLQQHAAEITYLPVDTPSVLTDLDTREQYRVSRQE